VRTLAVRVGLGLCFSVIACGGSSKTPPNDTGAGGSPGGAATAGKGGKSSSGGVGASNAGAEPSVVGGSPSCESCGGEGASEPVCQPYAQECQDNTVIACKPDGSGKALVSDCGAYFHCVELPGALAQCNVNVCTPEATVCDGNILKVCGDDGLLPTKGEDCGDDTCILDKCVPKTCEPSARSCKEGDVYECLANGTGDFLSQDCDDNSTCRELTAGPTCVSLSCTPGQPACVGEAKGICSSDGLDLATVSQDCAATDQICDLVSGCGTSASDVLGKKKEVESMAGADLATNVIDVLSSRKLVKIEANWLLDQTRDMRFVIYEWTGNEYEARYDEITSNNVGSGYFASDAMSFQLEAGKRYLIGSGLVVGEGYAYYDQAGWTRSYSFGSARGSAHIGHYSPLQAEASEQLYVLRLTTQAP
jgi:hypothetical protein